MAWQFGWSALTKAGALAQIDAEAVGGAVPAPVVNVLKAAVNGLAPLANQVIEVACSGDYNAATGGGGTSLVVKCRVQYP